MARLSPSHGYEGILSSGKSGHSWTDAERGNALADRQATKGIDSGTLICTLPEDNKDIPGGNWYDMEGREWQGDIQKAMKAQAERRARRHT